ncbi:MAG: hypothetical protein N3F67_06010 [Acidilobaceae archaeon]|nr:hypothetical protein [Acidilobaceae archaeon]
MRLLEQYASWHELLLEGYEAGRAQREEGEEVVVCGLGGSGAAGDFLAAIAQIYGLGISVRVYKGLSLPAWARGKLVYAISYSGETLETLACYRKALELGARAVAISSGGLLQQEAARRGLPWIKVREGLLPRAALPAMLGALLGSLGGLPEEELLSAYNSLKSFMADEAKPYAELAEGAEVLVVGACGEHGVVAERWRQEFSENAKMLAKSEVYPESAHNDIVAWQAPKGIKISFVSISGKGACREIMELVKEKYSLHGKAAEVELGEPSLSSLLRGAQLGGAASVLAAHRRNVEPEATPFISEYKQRLRRALSASSSS